MANKYALSEDTPANTDDALEGPLRIREIKQAYNERLGRDHIIGGISSPDVIAQGADSPDSGYHRRITIREETSAQGGNADNRLNASSTGINDGTNATNKMAEIWVEKHSGTANQTSLLFLGTEGTGNQRTVVTTDQTQTLTEKTLTGATLTNPVISGGSGSLDGVAIGATTPGTGKFSTLESTGAVTLGSDENDTITLKAKTSGLSTDNDPAGTIGANQMYAGIVGEIRMYAGATEPEGWLFCDGRQVLHTGTGNYSELYAAIGLTYTDTSEHGSTGNKRSSDDYFRIPNLGGRIPVGKGAGLATDGSELGTDALTTRTLGHYGADEDHKLTAAESGAGPHYHPVHLQDPGHNHDLEDIHHDWASGSNYHIGIEAANAPTMTKTVTTETTGITIKANHELDVAGTTETEAQGSDDDDTFRTSKTNLNAGVPAASAHTQMQPFVVINYIIKY